MQALEVSLIQIVITVNGLEERPEFFYALDVAKQCLRSISQQGYKPYISELLSLRSVTNCTAVKSPKQASDLIIRHFHKNPLTRAEIIP